MFAEKYKGVFRYVVDCMVKEYNLYKMDKLLDDDSVSADDIFDVCKFVSDHKDSSEGIQVRYDNIARVNMLYEMYDAAFHFKFVRRDSRGYMVRISQVASCIKDVYGLKCVLLEGFNNIARSSDETPEADTLNAMGVVCDGDFFFANLLGYVALAGREEKVAKLVKLLNMLSDAALMPADEQPCYHGLSLADGSQLDICAVLRHRGMAHMIDTMRFKH